MTEEEFNNLFDMCEAGEQAKDRLDIMLDYDNEKYTLFLKNRENANRKVEIKTPALSQKEVAELKIVTKRMIESYSNLKEANNV